MPKKVWKVEEFDGGINQKSDDRDLEKNQLAEAFNIDVSNKGIIRMPGNGKTLYDTLNVNNVNVVPSTTNSSIFTQGGFKSGGGLFQFSHDIGLDNLSIGGYSRMLHGVQGDSEFLCINDGASIHIWCDNGKSGALGPLGDEWILNAITLGNVHSHGVANSVDDIQINPVYYKTGNALRVCDSDFSIEDTGANYSSYTSSTGILVSSTAISFPAIDNSEDFHHQPISNYIKINDEIIAVVKQSTTSLTVLRGQFGTKETTHSSGNNIYHVNIPKKFIGIAATDTTQESSWDFRLKNARLYSDTLNTTFTTPATFAHKGWRECIQSLEPPNDYMIPGLRVYDGQVTAMALSGTTAGTEPDVHLNEPNPENDNNVTNLVISADSNPEKVLFSIHESKSANDNVIIGSSTDDGGVVSGQNAITVTGIAGTDFAASGFVPGETVIITGSSVTNGVAEILATVSATVIQITGEHESDESSGFEIRLEKDKISEDLLNKYVFGMSFMYDGGGSEVQESPIKMGQVHSGLIPHDASIGRSRDNWKDGTDLDANNTLQNNATNAFNHENGTFFFDDSEVSAGENYVLLYSGSSGTIENNAYYKISITVTMGSAAELTVYPPGTSESDTGVIGDGSSDGSTVVIDTTGTYLFYAQAGDDTEHVFVCKAKEVNNSDSSGDITIHNVQVYEATPKEMSESNAISMKSWQGVPKIFSSFNMTSVGDYNWDPEIIGYKIYMKQVDSMSQSLTDEWLLALKVDFREGEFANYTNNSESEPLHLANNWSNTGSSFGTSFVCTNKVGGNAAGKSYYNSMREIPLHTYESENGYKADTVTCAMYKTATQVGRKMYIGNILIDGKYYPDRILESPTDRPDTFPNDGLHYIDVATADGDEIIHLDSIGNKLIQFKKKTVYLIEVLDEGVELIDTWYNSGITLSSQIVRAGDGLVWANNYGLFYYDGDQLKTITAESFDSESWIINENNENATILGYDPYSKKVIIMTSNVSTHDSGGYIYDLTTNSITEHQNLFNWYSVVDEFQ
tara:strand:- start:15212 stop:18286 length:3075 start_codon:yes stop_codon:yes gene_type:complete